MILKVVRAVVYAALFALLWLAFGGLNQWWHALVLGALLGFADEAAFALFIQMKPKWTEKTTYVQSKFSTHMVPDKRTTLDRNGREVSSFARMAWAWNYRR